MKVKIHKQDLIDPINTVQKAISGRIPLPILEGIYFRAENNRITFMGTDGEISIQSTITAKVIEEGEIILGSRLSGGIIRKLPSATIYLTLAEHNLDIRCQQSEFSVMRQSAQEFPQVPKINNPIKIRLARESLVDSLRSTSLAVNLDDLRMALTGVLLDCKPGRISFIALDGYRMALNELEIQSDAEIQTIVPAGVCTEVVRLLDDSLDTILIELADNYIEIDLGPTIFISELISGEFSQYQGLVHNDHKINVKLKRRDFVQNLEGASLLAKEERSNLVKLDISANEILVESHSDIRGIHELIPCTIEGGDLEIAFNSRYLLEEARAIQEEGIIYHFIDLVNPCITESNEKSGYIYLALPIRLTGQ